MRYEVVVIEAGQKFGLGRVIEIRATKKAAKRAAEANGMEYHYGTAILDTKTGLVDYGDGFGKPQDQNAEEA